MNSTSTLRSLPAARVTGAAAWAAAKLRVAQWNHTALNPKRVQIATLLRFCHTAHETEFGRAHRLAAVRSHDDFVAQVPLRSYADFEPDLVRMRNGARDVLWPGLVPYYGQSSGTSNTEAKNKFLPITLQQIRWQQRAGFDVFARYVDISGDHDITGGYVLGLFPPSTVKQDGPVGIGTNPGLMQSHMPVFARLNSLPRPPWRDIEDYNLKLTRLAETYMDYDVRCLNGTTCWFSVFFDRLLDVARQRGRAASTIQDIWPNFRVLFGGGVHADPYRPIISTRIGRPTQLMDNYNATEGGIFACTDRADDPGLLVIPDRGVFFEFVPRDEHGKANARRLPLWRVEPGVEYSVAVTTASGLFGYVLGDFVRFTSVFPHRVVFTGRASGMLSVTQELTTSGELESAAREAAAGSACTIVDFAAAAEVGVDSSALGRYVFFVEFERAPEDLESFTRILDRALCTQNRVYREHRAKDVAILPPKVTPLAKGATRKFMEALGQHSVQQKFPRILDDGRRDLMRSFAREPSANGVKGLS